MAPAKKRERLRGSHKTSSSNRAASSIHPKEDERLTHTGMLPHPLPFPKLTNPNWHKCPGTARANIAASVESPNGTQKDNWAERYKTKPYVIFSPSLRGALGWKWNQILQQHLSFFDADSNGVIWPLDTYRGFYRLGYGIILSIVSLLIIHANFSHPTLSGYFPDPFFRIYMALIHFPSHKNQIQHHHPNNLKHLFITPF